MEFWLIPVLAMIVAGVVIFYVVVRRQGGSGSRADGHTVVDKPVGEQNTKGEWNYYK
jgi:hypothetical protein